MGIFGALTGWFGQNTATSNYLVSIGDTFQATSIARQKLPAIVRGVTLVSGDIGRLNVTAQRANGDPTTNPALDLINGEANQFQSGSAWRAWMVSTSLLYGNAYSFIQRDNNGEAIGLWPLWPGRIAINWLGFDPIFLLDGKQIDPYQIVSLLAGPGDHNNPYRCTSPLDKCAPSLSLAILQERVATALCESGRVGKISITHPGTLSQTAKLDLLDAYTRKHSTPEGATRPLVLDEGVKVERVGDGQLPGMLEDRKYANCEIARCLGIPPQMLFQGDAGALSSQIEMQRQYVETTIAPWCDRFATSLACKILPAGCKLKFDYSELTRGNLRDTSQSLKDLATTGALSIDDGRAILGMAPTAGGNMPMSKNTPAEAPTNGD